MVVSDGKVKISPVSSDRLMENDATLKRYESAMHGDDGWSALPHLNFNRGISTESVKRFRLGLVKDPYPGHGRYDGFLCIPYLDADGLPLTFRFRCLDNHACKDHHHGKYNSLPHDPARMFNVGSIHKADDVINVTEGELDAIILEQCGLRAVAIPGASSFRPHHKIMLSGFSRVVVWADPDDAGAEMLSKVMSSLNSAKPARLSIGDVNETFAECGEGEILRLFEAAL